MLLLLSHLTYMIIHFKLTPSQHTDCHSASTTTLTMKLSIIAGLHIAFKDSVIIKVAPLFDMQSENYKSNAEVFENDFTGLLTLQCQTLLVNINSIDQKTLNEPDTMNITACQHVCVCGCLYSSGLIVL